MYFYRALLLIILALMTSIAFSQETDSVFMISGLIYNRDYQPVEATHVININNYAGDVSDSLGIFRLPVSMGDTLLISNIAYMDTLVAFSSLGDSRIVFISETSYDLPGAKVFDWGSSYRDFKDAVVHRPQAQGLREQLGLPGQDPDYVPYNMDESHVESLGLLFTSPITYFYENFNRKARNRRKVYWLLRNRELHEIFNEITSPDNLSNITGLEGDELLKFMAFLFEKMECDHHCDELHIYSEIHAIWDLYSSDSNIK